MKINFKSILLIIKNNWQYKLLSLFLAIIVWFIIVQYVNPEDTRHINDIKIQVNTEDSVPVGEGLVLVTDYDESLNIVYKASRDVISVLNTDRITAYVDLSSATKSGEYSFPVKVDTNGQNIIILEQSVTYATLKFEKAATAQIPIVVKAEGSVPEGYVMREPVCVPSALNIEGPESKVSQIVAAEIVINQKEFKETKVYNCDYIFVDADGNEVSKDYITSDFQKIDVTVAVQKTKTIPITVKLINSSGGYENSFANVTVEPSTITVAGSEEVLETLNSYDLGTIDVTDKMDDFTQQFVVSLQNGLKNVDGVENVTVNVSFGEVKTKKLTFKQFQIENLPANQKAEIVNKSVDVVFRGIAADISRLTENDIKIVLDFNNKEQPLGKNDIALYVVIPDTYKIGVVGKKTVTVNISK